MATIKQPMTVALESDSSLASDIAHTICLAFAHDPLVKWLRPNAELWNTLTPEICKWQYRRVQRAFLDGFVFCTDAVEECAQVLPRTTSLKQNALETEIEKPDPSSRLSEDGVGAAIMLFPPKRYKRWTFNRLMLACKLWLMDSLDAAPDHGTCESRLEKLLNASSASLEKIRFEYKLKDLWYLEVVAVHPLLQGRGLGGKVMLWLLEYLNGKPVVLECTTESNVAFYERFGFKVVEEVELVDESILDGNEKFTYWVMLRNGRS